MNPTVPTNFLRILHRQWLTVQALILALNFLRDAEFFIEFGRRSHNLRASRKRPSGCRLNFGCL